MPTNKKNTKDFCNHKCPEIKHSNIFPQHKRRIYNFIKKEITFAVIISNDKVRDDIMQNKNSRERFRDYCQRRVIKKTIKYLIDNKIMDPHKPVKPIIRINQQGTSTDTNRAFVMDIKNELLNGVVNYNYNLIYPSILFSKLDIDLKYVVSNNHVCIQASDFIAVEVRKIILSNLNQIEKMKNLDFVDIKLFIP